MQDNIGLCPQGWAEEQPSGRRCHSGKIVCQKGLITLWQSDDLRGIYKWSSFFNRYYTIECYTKGSDMWATLYYICKVVCSPCMAVVPATHPHVVHIILHDINVTLAKSFYYLQHEERRIARVDLRRGLNRAYSWLLVCMHKFALHDPQHHQ